MVETIRLGLVMAAVALAAPWAEAGKGGSPSVPTVTKQKKSDNKAFIGIQWNLGVREGASVVLGYRWAKVGPDNKVNGTQIDFTYALTGKPGPGEMHVKGFDGKRNAQGELGVGYGFQAGAFLLNAGVQGPNVFAGADYLFGKGLQPYLGLNTIRRYKSPPDLLTCPVNYTLVDGRCID